MQVLLRVPRVKARPFSPTRPEKQQSFATLTDSRNKHPVLINKQPLKAPTAMSASLVELSFGKGITHIVQQIKSALTLLYP